MTSALEGGEWSAAHPGRTLPPGKTRYPFYWRLGGPQGWPGRAENLIPTGIWSRTFQPVVSRYTDWATRPTTCIYFTEYAVSLIPVTTTCPVGEGNIFNIQTKNFLIYGILESVKLFRYSSPLNSVVKQMSKIYIFSTPKKFRIFI
jgi:hypothetical protein